PALSVTVLLPEGPVTVPPPQVVERLAGVATTRKAGKVSVKARPLCAGLPAPLVMVKVTVDEAPVLTAVGLKVLVRSEPTTVRLAAAAPVPAVGVCVVVTPLVVLALATVELVTRRITV